MRKQRIQNNSAVPDAGFTFIELLLVLSIIGLFAAVIVPRGMRAQTESKYSMVRQYGSEIASYVIRWADEQARAQRAITGFSLKDILAEDITEADKAGITSNKLVHKYTGNNDFDPVEEIVPRESMPVNPFNKASYFSKANNDTKIPSRKPGLLYLTMVPDVDDKEYLNFYFIYTGQGSEQEGGQWAHGMDAFDVDKVRKGIFITRQYNDQDYGGLEEKTLVDWKVGK